MAPGEFGPVNAISPKYNRLVLDELLEVADKPPVLWIQGEDDNIISDQSFSDPGYQGKLELRKGWPGNKQYPPQPMITQIDYALQNYRLNGGAIHRVNLANCGHTPFIEKPEGSREALRRHLKGGND
ncbi:MAG: hypothetical protein U5J63_05930 [Fodinibius sp.]|nr:hypothetical protein [Fodinibius sp.]